MLENVVGDSIGLRVDTGAIELLFRSIDTEKSRTLLKGFGSDSFDLFDLRSLGE